MFFFLRYYFQIERSNRRSAVQFAMVPSVPHSSNRYRAPFESCSKRNSADDWSVFYIELWVCFRCMQRTESLRTTAFKIKFLISVDETNLQNYNDLLLYQILSWIPNQHNSIRLRSDRAIFMQNKIYKVCLNIVNK